MGSGVSSERNTQSRLRNALVLRAYNIRPKDITLEEQFAEYAYRKEQGGVLYISINDIKQVLSVDAPWIDDLFYTLIGSNIENEDDKHIQYDHFVEFLETGHYVGHAFTKATSNRSNISSNMNSEMDDRSDTSKIRIKSKGHGMRGKVSLKKPPPPIATNFAMNAPTTPGNHDSGPPSPPVGGDHNKWLFEQVDELEPPVKSSNQSHSGSAEKEREKEKDSRNRGSGSVSVGSSLHPEDSLSVDAIDEKSVNSNHRDKDSGSKDTKDSTLFTNMKYDHKPSSPISSASTALVKSKGLEVGDSSSFSIQEPGLARNMFRKSEVLKQERIIKYTTVDANGQTQELTETETTQTEVLHMECRDTGQFARRETTRFEHVEKFNEEIVNEESGKEEYVHLKSKDDEYEFTDSSMPPRTAADQPQSPRVNNDGKHDEGAEDQTYPEGYDAYIPTNDTTGENNTSQMHNTGAGEGYTLSEDAAAYCSAYAEQQAERLCAQAGEELGSRFWQEAYKQAVELATEAILENELKNNHGNDNVDVNDDVDGNVAGNNDANINHNAGINSNSNEEMFHNTNVQIDVDVDMNSQTMNSTGMPSATASTHPKDEGPGLSPLSPTPFGDGGFNDPNPNHRDASIIHQTDYEYYTRNNTMNDENMGDAYNPNPINDSSGSANDGPVFMDMDELKACRARAQSSSRVYDLHDDVDDVDNKQATGNRASSHHERKDDKKESRVEGDENDGEYDDQDDDASMRGSISPGSLRDIQDFNHNPNHNNTSTTDAPPSIVNMNDNGNDVKEFSDID